MVGADCPNLVVLRSPSKFYGIAATRVGVAWSRDPVRLRSLVGRQETWPISGLDARIGEAALTATAWAADSRPRLARDARWLSGALDRVDAEVVRDGVGVHYRCLLSPHAPAMAGVFARHGIGVRVLGAAHGVHPGALRILAPLPHQRDAVLAAVEEIARGRFLRRPGAGATFARAR